MEKEHKNLRYYDRLLSTEYERRILPKNSKKGNQNLLNCGFRNKNVSFGNESVPVHQSAGGTMDMSFTSFPIALGCGSVHGTMPPLVHRPIDVFLLAKFMCILLVNIT